MRDSNLALQRLCASADLRDGEGSFTFDVLEHGRAAAAFAVRFEGRAVAYLNRCAHVPAELDWQPGQFWDADKRFIICSVHGALYEPRTGVCVMGPCPGKRLVSIALTEQDGDVFWQPTEHLQPVF
jgi:nitrite reductase/ring-hydroxylating ferredoxin subunit